MSSEDRDLATRRIVVALDASGRSVDLLEAIADLAADLGAELVGLFVEDVTLLRATELPFTREVGLLSASLRHLQTEQLERQLRAQARRMRQVLNAIAERRGLPWSFRVARGIILAELLKAAAESDLIVWSRTGRPPTARRLRLGAVPGLLSPPVYRVMPQPQRRAQPRQPILLVYDGSTAGQRALAAAVHLAQAGNSHVVVVLVANNRDQAQQLRLQVGARLRAHAILGQYQWLDRAEVSQLASIVARENVGTVVLPMSQNHSRADETLRALLDAMDCPLWLVR